MNKVELLAPAGDYEKAQIALDYGADAIYIGAKAYSLRARASNFDFDDVAKTCEYAHKLNKKVYIVTNILCHNSMLGEYKNFLEKLLKCKPDGLICADPYIIKTTRELNKEIEIHLSTQQSVTNSKAALFFKRQDVNRVVLAREVSYEELKPLVANLNNLIQVEYFIHGAVCIAYSGRCMMSNNYSLRDANIGGCAQSCRWTCELSDENKIYTNKFTMSAKDMAQMPNIDQLIATGISSFKIEGRMKSEHYIATIVSNYKKAIDEFYQNGEILDKTQLINEIDKAANRETSIAWFNGEPTINEMLYHDVEKVVSQVFAFKILKVNPDSYQIISKNHFNKNDKLELIGGKHEKYLLTIKTLLDDKNLPIETVSTPMKIFNVTFNEQLPIFINDIARILKK